MIDFQNAKFLKLRPVDNETFASAILPMFAPGEGIVASFKSVRDGVVFTNKRIIAINIQGITGKKTDYATLPYSKVQSFSIETAGVFDLDSELQLWFSGLGLVTFEFTARADITKLCAIISAAIL